MSGIDFSTYLSFNVITMLIFYSDSELLSLGALEGALFDVTSLDDFGVFSLFGIADFDS